MPSVEHLRTFVEDIPIPSIEGSAIRAMRENRTTYSGAVAPVWDLRGGDYFIFFNMHMELVVLKNRVFMRHRR